MSERIRVPIPNHPGYSGLVGTVLWGTPWLWIQKERWGFWWGVADGPLTPTEHNAIERAFDWAMGGEANFEARRKAERLAEKQRLAQWAQDQASKESK